MNNSSKKLGGTSELRSANYEGSGHFRASDSTKLVIYGLSWVLKTSNLTARVARPLHVGIFVLFSSKKLGALGCMS